MYLCETTLHFSEPKLSAKLFNLIAILIRVIRYNFEVKVKPLRVSKNQPARAGRKVFFPINQFYNIAQIMNHLKKTFRTYYTFKVRQNQ